MYRTLEITTELGITTIWMNRPEVHNAFDEVLIAELDQAVQQLSDDDNTRVVILAGRGKSFSAGADLNWMKRAASYTHEENMRDALALANMLRRVAEMPKPTVARVQGAALGGGTGLVAACDIAVASTAAIFATSEVRFGILAATISPYVLRAIGARQANRYFQTAERISAERALKLGLVHEVSAPEEIDRVVLEIVEQLLLGGPKAQAASKALVRAVDNRVIDDAVVRDTAERIAGLRATPEGAEGLSAFLEKRTPSWRL